GVPAGCGGVAEQRGGGAEAARPEAVAEDDRRRTTRRVLFGQEDAAQRGAHAEEREHVRSGAHAADALGPRLAREVQALALREREVFEDGCPGLDGRELPRRRPVLCYVRA